MERDGHIAEEQIFHRAHRRTRNRQRHKLVEPVQTAVPLYPPSLHRAGGRHVLSHRLSDLSLVHELHDQEPAHRQRRDWVGLRNYERILRNQVPLPNFDFWNILTFNIVWTISNVFFHVVIGVAVALLLNRKRIYGRKFWRAIYVIPWAMPPLVVATVWKNMFDTQFGAINQLLAKLSLPSDINWLGSTKAPFPGSICFRSHFLRC